jgi:hypothetical protein
MKKNNPKGIKGKTLEQRLKAGILFPALRILIVVMNRRAE